MRVFAPGPEDRSAGKTQTAALEKFIREEGARAYDEYMAHPELAMPIDEAFAELDRRIAEFEANGE